MKLVIGTAILLAVCMVLVGASALAWAAFIFMMLCTLLGYTPLFYEDKTSFVVLSIVKLLALLALLILLPGSWVGKFIGVAIGLAILYARYRLTERD